MRGINKVILVGNIGKDPEVQYLEGENPIPVAKFPLATTEMRKEKNGGQIPETTWHNIVLWRGLAELAGKYLKKEASYILKANFVITLLKTRIKIKNSIPKLLPKTSSCWTKEKMPNLWMMKMAVLIY